MVSSLDFSLIDIKLLSESGQPMMHQNEFDYYYYKDQLEYRNFAKIISNLIYSPFSPSPPWSEMGGGPAGHQVLSENAI